MSTIVTALCWPLDIPLAPKMVLISLADNANDHGECWPLLKTIGKRASLGRTALIDALKWLEEKGLLEIERAPGVRNRYTVKPPGMNPDLFESPPNQSAKRTGPPSGRVRQVDWSGSRTRPSDGLDPSAKRTGPVRQADPLLYNRKEPSLNQREERAPAGTRLPPTWEPSAEDHDFARRERPDLDLAAELAKFRDHWAACPGRAGVKADWSATWRNWIRRADPPRAGSAPPPAVPAAPRDWRQPSETPLERDIAYVRHQHAMGAYGEGPDADRERDRLLEAARQRHGAKLEAEPV